MKHIFKLSLICAVTVLASCKKDTSLTPNEETTPDANTDIQTRLSSFVGERNPSATFTSQVDLIAGQNTVVGYVLVESDADNVYVTYKLTKANAKLTETHLYVGECGSIPVNCYGNPKVGNFPYASTTSTCSGYSNYSYEITYVVPNPNACVCIAAHSVVKTGCKTETAWGSGDRFVAQGSWATYFGACFGGPIDPP